jgi:hypothetical protein
MKNSASTCGSAVTYVTVSKCDPETPKMAAATAPAMGRRVTRATSVYSSVIDPRWTDRLTIRHGVAFSPKRSHSMA